MRLCLSLRPLAGLLAALALAGCGGGGSSSSQASSGGTPTPPITVGALANITSPTGASAITHMVDGLVIGDHAVLRSDSADASQPYRPPTRFTVIDAQGNASASVDYGYTLAPGYNGAWAMQPLPGGAGFVLIQLAGGSRMFQFDAQGKMTGSSSGINLYEPLSASDAPVIEVSATALDGNGIWVGTTFRYTQANGSFIWRILLTKFDFNGKALTPTAALTTSTKLATPRLAASAGAVSVYLADGSQPTLAYWAQGGGGFLQKSNNAGNGSATVQPIALNSSGKLGLLWNYNSILNGVALNASGDPLLTNSTASDWSAEVLSSKWTGVRRGLVPGITNANGRLMITDLVDDPAYAGDSILVVDYVLNDGPLSAVTPQMALVRRPLGHTVDKQSTLRQLVFSDHTLLLVGDSDHLEGAVVTRH